MNSELRIKKMKKLHFKVNSFFHKISIKPSIHLQLDSEVSSVFTNMSSKKLVGLRAFGPLVSLGEFYFNQMLLGAPCISPLPNVTMRHYSLSGTQTPE